VVQFAHHATRGVHFDLLGACEPRKSRSSLFSTIVLPIWKRDLQQWVAVINPVSDQNR
jgi:hypothetical protein